MSGAAFFSRVPQAAFDKFALHDTRHSTPRMYIDILLDTLLANHVTTKSFSQTKEAKTYLTMTIRVLVPNAFKQPGYLRKKVNT